MTFWSKTGGGSWRNRVTNWETPAKRNRSIGSGWPPIRVGDGAGSDGPTVIGSRARNGRICNGPNRSCEKGFRSPMSGTVLTWLIASPMYAKSRDATRRRRNSGVQPSGAPWVWRSRRISVRLARSCGNRPNSTSAAKVYLSANYPMLRRGCVGRPRRLPLPGKKSGATSPALAAAARNTRNAVAFDGWALPVGGPHADSGYICEYPSSPSELNLRKTAREEGSNRGRLQD